MATDALRTLFNERHRLWTVPLLTSSAALAVFHARVGEGGPMRAAVEMACAGALGFLIAAAWSSLDNAKAKARKAPPRVEQVIASAAAKREIDALRHELRAMEQGMTRYLDAKKSEGQTLRNAIIDLNNDVSRLRGESTGQQLKPQLEAIAEKFNELAGVRQAVSKLSMKMRRVEDIALKVTEAEARVQAGLPEAAHQAQEQAIAALKSELGLLRGELGSELKREMTEVVEQKVAKRGDSLQEMLLGKAAPLAAKAPVAAAPAASATSTATPVANSIEIDDVMEQVSKNLDQIIEGRVGALVKGLRRVSSGDLAAVPDLGTAEIPAIAPRQGLRPVPQAVSQANSAVSSGMTPANPQLQVVANSGQMGAVDSGQFETIERRLMKMAQTIDALKDKIESLRFEGPAAEERGIPSKFRAPAGIDVTAPENAVKGGCLAKLFQANLALHKAAA